MNRSTHAGGVVYRWREGAPEFLLVTARRPPHDWFLPKGRIERGETAEQAAVREVDEEAGVRGTIERRLGELLVAVRGSKQRVTFFLMAMVEEGRAREERQLSWRRGDDAVAALAFPDTRDLMRIAASLVGPNPTLRK
jgi:8-oxo-dGTP pyrophosphatase MutT (NUDIX family)